MSAHLVSRFTRLVMSTLILAVLVLALPRPAAAAYPTFDIMNVRSDESVTIRTHNFPANVKFIIRMDVAGNRAENGIAVAEMNSGRGGEFEATVMIPSQLKGEQAIAIRVDSQEGYFAYNWFTNQTSGPTQPETIPVTGSGKPYLTISNIKPNESVLVEARNLPTNTTFTVRVGPYYSFFKNYVTAPSVKSDANGTAKFTVSLPSVVKNVELVTVRMDGGGKYAFNAFKNVAGGSTGTGVIPVTSGACQLVSVTPAGSVARGADLDLTWTVKNTSGRTWSGSSVDYQYVSGTKFHKRGDRYDLRQDVKSSETVSIAVDVIAPSTAGSYTTTWAIVEGQATICTMSYTLRVK